jgi:hypothetical protein
MPRTPLNTAHIPPHAIHDSLPHHLDIKDHVRLEPHPAVGSLVDEFERRLTRIVAAQVIAEIDASGGACAAVRGASEELGCEGGAAERGGVPEGLLGGGAEEERDLSADLYCSKLIWE